MLWERCLRGTTNGWNAAYYSGQMERKCFHSYGFVLVESVLITWTFIVMIARKIKLSLEYKWLPIIVINLKKIAFQLNFPMMSSDKKLNDIVCLELYWWWKKCPGKCVDEFLEMSWWATRVWNYWWTRGKYAGKLSFNRHLKNSRKWGF